MNFKIDSNKLNRVGHVPHAGLSSDSLRREARIFFIGADLPVYSTLETMYESYCQESSEMFHVTFGDADRFEHNLEMVRQIKRNFSMHLMGRINYKLSESQIERVYLAGLDLLDIPFNGFDKIDTDDTIKPANLFPYRSAAAIFRRWGTVSTIDAGQATPQELSERIKLLLETGVVPLLDFSNKKGSWSDDEIAGIYRLIADEWRRYKVGLKTLLPYLRLTTPFLIDESSGFMRGVFDKLHDRRIMAASDLRRHLRTSGAEASFESAGL